MIIFLAPPGPLGLDYQEIAILEDTVYLLYGLGASINHGDMVGEGGFAKCPYYQIII